VAAHEDDGEGDHPVPRSPCRTNPRIHDEETRTTSDPAQRRDESQEKPMNDEEALKQINKALSLWFDGKQGPIETLNRIAQITGENTAA
jgi:hypothetical protein